MRLILTFFCPLKRINRVFHSKNFIEGLDISNYNKLERMCSGSQFQIFVPLIEEMMAKETVFKIIISFYPNFLF